MTPFVSLWDVGAAVAFLSFVKASEWETSPPPRRHPFHPPGCRTAAQLTQPSPVPTAPSVRLPRDTSARSRPSPAAPVSGPCPGSTGTQGAWTSPIFPPKHLPLPPPSSPSHGPSPDPPSDPGLGVSASSWPDRPTAFPLLHTHLGLKRVETGTDSKPMFSALKIMLVK